MLYHYCLITGFTVNMKMPGVEAQVFLPCKSDEECKAISCGKGSAHCLKGQCHCDVVFADDKLSASTNCKTTPDCKKH